MSKSIPVDKPYLTMEEAAGVIRYKVHGTYRYGSLRILFQSYDMDIMRIGNQWVVKTEHVIMLNKHLGRFWKELNREKRRGAGVEEGDTAR